MDSYKDLKVWQRSLELVKAVYLLTDKFPSSEVYGLTSQMRRAVVSVPSNTAEGYQRRNRPDYLRFLRILFGSAAELETQLNIAKNLKIGDEKPLENAENLLIEVLKMLNKLIQSLTSIP